MSTPFVPFLETVTKGARAAYPVIRALVAGGYGGQEIYETLQAAGMGARKADVLAIVRNEQGAELARSDIERFLKDTVPDLSRIRESATKIVAPFSYTLRLSLFDPYTGHTTQVTRQAHSSELLSPNAAADMFLSNHPDNLYDEDQIIKDAQVIDIQRAGPQGTL